MYNISIFIFSCSYVSVTWNIFTFFMSSFLRWFYIFTCIFVNPFSCNFFLRCFNVFMNCISVFIFCSSYISITWNIFTFFMSSFLRWFYFFTSIFVNPFSDYFFLNWFFWCFFVIVCSCITFSFSFYVCIFFDRVTINKIISFN